MRAPTAVGSLSAASTCQGVLPFATLSFLVAQLVVRTALARRRRWRARLEQANEVAPELEDTAEVSVQRAHPGVETPAPSWVSRQSRSATRGACVAWRAPRSSHLAGRVHRVMPAGGNLAHLAL